MNNKQYAKRRAKRRGDKRNIKGHSTASDMLEQMKELKPWQRIEWSELAEHHPYSDAPMRPGATRMPSEINLADLAKTIENFR